MTIPKVKSATVFRNDLYETLKEVGNGTPYLVTQKDGDPVVLISQTEYNRLLAEQVVLRNIAAGVADLESGKVVPHKTAVSRLRKLQEKWK
ncbi:MAG TPA: type II toxin-antitoxin system Phd/YefM family antitoxin [Bdellovibrionota bacterium]|nr:type II toxin-antitoxin system Phd/YefM family antitoxin [Bdellovibrionota bacterium]